MESLRSYGTQGLAYAKANPKMVVAGLSIFVIAVLAIVLVFNARKLDVSKIQSGSDDEKKSQASALMNAKRSAIGLLVMAVIGLIAAGALYYQKK